MPRVLLVQANRALYNITINVPLFKKLRDIMFFCGTITLLAISRDNLRGQKSLGPLKLSREMDHKVILLQKKHYVPNFLKQRNIGNFMSFLNLLSSSSSLTFPLFFFFFLNPLSFFFLLFPIS